MRQTAVELADAIRRGERSPLEAVEEQIELIERIDPWLNAVVVRRFEEARAEARAAERAPATAPLHGVPVTVKEALEMDGAAVHERLAARRGRDRWERRRGRAQAARRGRDRARQDEPVGVLLLLRQRQSRLRTHRQPARSRAHAWRLIGRRGGGGRCRAQLSRRRLRPRQLDPPAGGLVRRVRPEADPRAGVERRARRLRHPAGLRDVRVRRAAGAQRGGPRARAASDGERRADAPLARGRWPSASTTTTACRPWRAHAARRSGARRTRSPRPGTSWRRRRRHARPRRATPST